jgi:hypothetical protein
MWWLKLIGVYLFGSGLAQVAASLQRLRGSASAPQPFQPPTVAAGTPIPVLYGTLPVPPIVTWLGDVKTREVFAYQNPRLLGFIHFAGPQQFKVAYAYSVTLQGILCWGKTSAPINVLFGDRVLLSNQPATQRQYDPTGDVWFDVPTSDQDWFAIEEFNAGRKTAHYALPSVWGEPGHGGGFGGPVTFSIGGRQHGPNPVMQAKINPGGVGDPVNNVPSYNDLASVVYDDVEVGESPTPPPVKYILRRHVDHPVPDLLDFSDTTSRAIQHGAGPSWTIQELTHVAMLYDAMRSSRYGGGQPEWTFDTTAWKVAVQRCFDEGLYGSWLLGGGGQQGRLGDLRDEVEKVVDGQAFESPVTGQWRFTLNRNEATTVDDYNALPAFDERHMRNLEWYEAQPSEVINQVTVEFRNAAKLWAIDTVTLTNNASVGEIGLKPQTIRLESVTDPAVALKICARELRRGSTALARGKAIGTRVFWSAELGSCFRLSNAAHKLNGLVVRVTSIDYGTPQNGEIALEFVEDVFGHPNVIYSGPETPPVVTSASIIRPAVTKAVSSVVGSLGQLAITLVDPQHRVTEIAFNRQSGSGPASDWTVVATAAPNTADPTFPYNATVTLGDLQGDYVTQVALSAVGTAAIAYRIRYVGTSATDIQEITGESAPFDIVHRRASDPPTIALTASLAGAIPTALAIVSEGVVSVQFAASLTGDPSSADVDAATPTLTTPFKCIGPPISLGQTWHVAARALDSNGNVSTLARVSVSIAGSLSTPWLYTRSRTNYFHDAAKTIAVGTGGTVNTWAAAPGTTRDLVTRYFPGSPDSDLWDPVQQDGAAIRFGDKDVTALGGRGAFLVPDMSGFTEGEIILVLQRAAAPISDSDGAALLQLGDQGNDADYFPRQSDGHWISRFGSAKTYDLGVLPSAIINGTDGPHTMRILSSATRWAAYLDGVLIHEDLSPSPAFDQGVPVIGENVLGGHFNGFVWSVLIFDLVNTDAQAAAWVAQGISDATGTPPDDGDDGGPPAVGGAAGDEGDVQYNSAGILAGKPFRDFGRWEPLTNGNPAAPELVFLGGDVIMVFVPE